MFFLAIHLHVFRGGATTPSLPAGVGGDCVAFQLHSLALSSSDRAQLQSFQFFQSPFMPVQHLNVVFDPIS